ncbi:MAG: hypothetical protein KDK59_02140 [Simkania sp.]|nr:hypothetical protein [Simkania sp.]
MGKLFSQPIWLFPFYHYFPKDRRLRCNPSFDPYGSFIFEDRVFWIGRSWDKASDQALMDFLENR